MTDLVSIPLLERYQRLIEISRDLASTLDLDNLLGRIVHLAADLVEAEAASILLYDENSKQLHFRAATNLEEPLMEGLPVPVDASLSGWIVMNRQPILIADAENDPRHFDSIGKAIDMTTRTLLGVPVMNKNRIIGVLETINKRQGEFTQEDLELTMALASQAAIAIENARLFHQSDLISEMVHELRTPLASLSTATHLMMRPEVSEEQRRRMVEIIQGETNRLSDMATSYLDLARLESGRAQYRLEPFSLITMIQECTEVMQSRASEKGIQLIQELPENLPDLRADRNKIKQVLLNLLSNAIKYNHSGGTIRVRAGLKVDMFWFSVQDTGPGLPPDQLAHLFEKFYRAPGTEQMASGTGLGLSICKYIVEAHRGRINVESELGKGTIFTTMLPVK